MKKNVKQHIIETASKLFYENGYQATGVNEIIAKSDIAKATLYHHFKSKEDICIAYLSLKHDNFMNGFKLFISDKTDSSARLLGIFNYLRELYRKEDFNGCWAIKTLGELPKKEKRLRSYIQKQKTELLNFLGEIVANSIINVSKAETEKISSGIYLLYESAITESVLHHNDWPIFTSKTIALKLLEDYELL